jgi:hypothetical protein
MAIERPQLPAAARGPQSRLDTRAKPIFAVILRDGDRWTVEAEWPDGTIEQAIVVKSASDARSWINNTAEAWVRGRLG